MNTVVLLDFKVASYDQISLLDRLRSILSTVSSRTFSGSVRMPCDSLLLSVMRCDYEHPEGILRNWETTLRMSGLPLHSSRCIA